VRGGGRVVESRGRETERETLFSFDAIFYDSDVAFVVMGLYEKCFVFGEAMADVSFSRNFCTCFSFLSHQFLFGRNKCDFAQFICVGEIELHFDVAGKAMKIPN
jgi:hypothetical protein